MPNTNSHAPCRLPQVMVSSTYTDLHEHRAALIKALNKHHMHPNVMEHDDAKLTDVVESSLKMVRDSEAYILLVSLKYGQTPEDPTRNPNKLSITELEFNEAQRLDRPTLLFIMHEDHPTKKSDIEKDPEKEVKLNAFRERAKIAAPGSKVHRVYSVFMSVDDFKDKINSSIAELEKHLSTQPPVVKQPSPPPQKRDDAIPIPPAFYAERDYIGRHNFIGRQAQLQILSEWAKPEDKTNVLLFEAIGGNGKSMLTWHWAKDEQGQYATQARSDWAGRFWYSFYECGAIMRDFCQHALAYMTGEPLESFAKRPMAELHKALLAQLHAKPWLLILDGLERVLVAYHRIDAAEVPDEEANRPTDKILNRDPCDAIRDEDTDLLRALAGAAPSKILISSRLIPRVLLNQAGIPLPGVKPLVLPGLDEADAEALLRSCGIEGTSADIRYYLTNYCANHPLVIGVLAGLINSPGPHRGKFDAWAADPAYGAKLNLASLDLIQSRNHILRAALDALEPASRQLLSTLALLNNAVEYKTVAAFNPHLPPEPEEVGVPRKPEGRRHWIGDDYKPWDDATNEEKAKLRQQYEAELIKRKEYEQAMQDWRNSEAFCQAPQKLSDIITDLEHRGLLQYDGRTQRYDLHPVVRGVASGGMQTEDKERFGQFVVDHFASQPHIPYREAKTMEDVENGLHIVRTLLKLGHFEEAFDEYKHDLATALLANLEAIPETLAILRHFFSDGWESVTKNITDWGRSYVANDVGRLLLKIGEVRKALVLFSVAIVIDLETDEMFGMNTTLVAIPTTLSQINQLAAEHRITTLVFDLSSVRCDDEHLFYSRCCALRGFAKSGLWQEAQETWILIEQMGTTWPRQRYRQGELESLFAEWHFWQGTLQDEYLAAATTRSEQDNNRASLRYLHWLRGAWRLEQHDYAQATASFQEAVRMARERRLVDEESETGLAVAKFHLGQFTGEDARNEAERLAQLRQPAHRFLAMLWQAIGNLEQAKKHALAAYKWAWADGEPYVNRYELTKSTELLNALNVPIPQLPPYDPSKDEPFPWEADVRAAIEKLRAEKEANKGMKEEEA